jgi:5-methylcytosine-specific restriction endonuclease McrBC GTP-binding regulatory subunit McrB
MNFISVPVQPSWDSQESMLGFFNSIDNRFEPEPLLKYLVQCTEDEKYSPYMSIVLLDEMNLAHVEHYFAEFLSKLETRRGTAAGNVPAVEVKLGAGVEPYELKLKRNILWTGTMNQDETTKSLSDKVLDRGLVIYFPRPHTLINRTALRNLAAMMKDRKMLTEAAWNNWIIRNMTETEESPVLAELGKYKKIVEEINDILENVGRALGHRVWQSIMNYILNYPTVSEVLRTQGVRDDKKRTWNFNSVEVTEELKNNMRTAFEDQIVQKIMPKLRGIETRGKGNENLQKIEDLLESKGFEKLKDDFDIACKQGYGQFMWSSAKYIEADIVKTETQVDTLDGTSSSGE